MYKSFYIKNFSFDYFGTNISSQRIEDYKSSKKALKYNKEFEEKITKYFNDNQGNIFVNEILDNIFPEIKANIFLSHAHADAEEVVKLACFLEDRYHCNVFIDSLVWGNVFNLLRQIDNACCIIDDIYFSYDQRNWTTSNLFLILNTALNKIIEQSNYFFFLETKESTTTLQNKFLTSPWIYSELFFASVVKKREPPKNEILFIDPQEISTENLAMNEALPNFFYPIPKLDFIFSFEKFIKLIDKQYK